MHLIMRLSLAFALAAAFAPGSASTAQTLSPELLEAVRRGATYLRIPEGEMAVPILGPPDLPLVEARLNGHGPYRLLIDLGSNVVIFRRNVIDEAGAEVVVEREGADIVRLDSLRIGDAVYMDVYGGSYDALDVDGVIGYNLLRETSFTLDFPGRRLVLHGDSLPSPDDRTVFHYLVEDRLPYITARIGADSVLLAFDTGATNQVVFPGSWRERLPLASEPVAGPTLYNNQTSAVQVELAPLAADITFGSYTIHRPTVIIDPSVEDAWLGAALLKDYVLDFDPQRQRVRINGPEEVTPPPPIP